MRPSSSNNESYKIKKQDRPAVLLHHDRANNYLGKIVDSLGMMSIDRNKMMWIFF